MTIKYFVFFFSPSVIELVIGTIFGESSNACGELLDEKFTYISGLSHISQLSYFVIVQFRSNGINLKFFFLTKKVYSI